jgi:hypothetical protein
MRGWQAGSITGVIAVVALALRFAPFNVGMWALAVALVIGGALAWRGRARGGRLRTWATSTGWAWWGDDDQSLAQVSHHYPFGSSPQKVSEAMRGSFGGREAVSFVTRLAGRDMTDVIASQFGWRFGNPEGDIATEIAQREIRFHIVAVKLPMWLPTIEVVPETYAVKAEKATGAQDIQFESDQFNRAFRVQARDLHAAYALIQPVLMERLLRDDARTVAWRTDGNWVMSWQLGTTDLDSLARRLGVLSAVAGSIRPHVWQQYGVDTAGWDPTAPPTSAL